MKSLKLPVHSGILEQVKTHKFSHYMFHQYGSVTEIRAHAKSLYNKWISTW